jgi:hypothetical protein
VILNPINDADCLDQLTRIARELVPTTAIQTVARRLCTRDRVIRWFHSLPQANDHGEERVRFVQCDVPQRARLLPDDPNCVERAMAAMMLLEVLDPRTQRALATVERPERHTGLVEKHGRRWYAIDLFPRRNAFSWGEFGKDVLQGVHKYVGQPFLSAYGLGGAGEWLGGQENKWIGRDKKQPEKKQSPPPGGKAEQEGAAAGVGSKVSSALVSRVVGSGASKSGGPDGQEKVQSAAGGGPASARPFGGRNAPAAARDRGDSHDEGAFAQCFWWLRGW